MAQTEPVPKLPAPRRRLNRPIRIALEATVVASMLAAGIGLVGYQTRKIIARDLATDWLRRQGVEADIDINRLDAKGFSGRIRLGPAADPDFVADRVDIDYAFTPPWSDAPFAFAPRSVRLTHPRVKLGFDGKALHFGSLDPIIQDLLKRPKSNQPLPDILIKAGEGRVTTPYGLVEVRADTEINAGKLITLEGRILPTTLRAGEASAQLTDTTVSLRGDGQDIHGRIGLSAREAGLAANRARDVSLGLTLTSLRYRLDDGTLKISTAGRVQGLASSVDASGAKLTRAVTDLTFDTVKVTLGEQIFGSFNVAGNVGADSGAAADATARAVQVRLQSRQAAWRLTSGRFALKAPLTATGTAERLLARLDGGPVTATAIKAGFKGVFDSAAASTLRGQASASGTGAFAAKDAQRIAAQVPVLSGEGQYATAMERALERFDLTVPRIDLALGGAKGDVRLSAPVTLTSASGVRASLGVDEARPITLDKAGIAGRAELAIEGGGLPPIALTAASFSLRGGDFDGQIALDTTLDFGPAKAAVVHSEGRAIYRKAVFTYEAPGCGPVSANHLLLGETIVQAPAGEICGVAGSPLITAGSGGWRMNGRIAGARAAIPDLAVKGEEAGGRFQVKGNGEALGVHLDLTDAKLTDTGEQIRFKPLRAKGAADLAADVWRGAFDVRTAGGYPVGAVTLEHDDASGAGHADLDASRLIFADGGLQPIDVSPYAAILDTAVGPASFVGKVVWTKDDPITASGRVTTPGLGFISAAGPIAQLKADVTFTSLTPLVTAPDQVISVGLIDAFAPLKDVRLVFDIAGDILKIDSGALSAVGGKIRLEPISLPFAEGQTITGALVLDKVNLGDVIGLSSLADKIKADLVIDGRVPFEYGPKGFRLLKGEIHTVKPGRLSISREALSGVETGAATAVTSTPIAGGAVETKAPIEVNAVQDFAFQAMESLAVDDLHATLESLPGGRLSMLFSIKGEHDPEKDEPALIGIRELLDKTAFKRRIPLPKGTPIDLTLDTSLNFDEVLEGLRSSFETFESLRQQARSDKVQAKAP